MARNEHSEQAIHLIIGNVTIKGKNTTNSEAYFLKVDTANMKITIVGRSCAGVFWGIQSLLSLEKEGKVSHVTIRDEPRYDHRELGVDVARNFMPKEEIMKLIDAMAMYKLNKLHLHLTDDEGWRLEIPGLPELTEVSGNLDSRVFTS